MRPLRRLPGVSAAEMARCLPAVWRHCLGGFRRIGLGMVELCKFDLIYAGENHSCLCEFDKLFLYNLVHFLQFTDVSLEVRRVGWSRG